MKNSKSGGQSGPRQIKLTISAGAVTPTPPVGPIIGAAGIPLPKFCADVNAATAHLPRGAPVPIIVTVNPDRTFSFVIKEFNTSYLIKEAAQIQTGSKKAGIDASVGTISNEQVRAIALRKLADMGGDDVSLESAMNMVRGTALSMGVKIKE